MRSQHAQSLPISHTGLLTNFTAAYKTPYISKLMPKCLYTGYMYYFFHTFRPSWKVPDLSFKCHLNECHLPTMTWTVRMNAKPYAMLEISICDHITQEIIHKFPIADLNELTWTVHQLCNKRLHIKKWKKLYFPFRCNISQIPAGPGPKNKRNVCIGTPVTSILVSFGEQSTESNTWIAQNKVPVWHVTHVKPLTLTHSYLCCHLT